MREGGGEGGREEMSSEGGREGQVGEMKGGRE